MYSDSIVFLGYLAGEINEEGILVPLEYNIPPAPNISASDSELEVGAFTLRMSDHSTFKT